MGIYSVNYAIPYRTIMLLMSIFVVAAGPISIQVWEKQGVEISQKFLTKIARYIIFICLPMTVGLSILASPIVNIIVTPEYYEGYRIIPIVALSCFFNCNAYSFALVFSYIKKTYIYSVMALIASLLNIVLNLIYIPKYGYMAAAVTTLISYSAYSFLVVVISKKYLVWDFPFKFLGKAAISTVVMGIIVYYINNILAFHVLINLVVTVTIGILIYFGVLFLIGGFQKNEIEILSTFIKRRIRC